MESLLDKYASLLINCIGFKQLAMYVAYCAHVKYITV